MIILSQGPASVEDRAMAPPLPPPHMTPPSSPPPPPPRHTQVPPRLPLRRTLALRRAARATTPRARVAQATAEEPSGHRLVAVVPALLLLSPSMDPSGTVSWKEEGIGDQVRYRMRSKVVVLV